MGFLRTHIHGIVEWRCCIRFLARILFFGPLYDYPPQGEGSRAVFIVRPACTKSKCLDGFLGSLKFMTGDVEDG